MVCQFSAISSSSILEFHPRRSSLPSWTEFFHGITMMADFDINFINTSSRTLDVKAQNVARPTADTRPYFRHCPRPGIEYLSRQCQGSVDTVFLPTRFTELSAGPNKSCFYAVRSASAGRPEYNEFYNIALSVGTPSRLCHLPWMSCAIFKDFYEAQNMFLILSTYGFIASVFQVTLKFRDAGSRSLLTSRSTKRFRGNYN